MKTAKVSAILLFLLFAIALPALTYAAAIGKITAFEGNVDILRRGQERAAPVMRVEEPVSEGDIVRTKSNGKTEITFTDNSVVRLAPGTRLQITEYLMEGNKRKSGVMNLFRGKIRAVVSKSRGFLGVAFGGGNRFEVRTPTAVAGVKGTDFFVSYSMGVTSILVTDGKVDVFNPAIPGQTVLVTTGNGTFIAGDKPPSPPRPATDVEMIRYTGDTTFGYTPGGGTPPPTDTGGFAGTPLIPSSDVYTDLLSDATPPVISIAGPSPYTNSSTAAFTVTFNEPVSATYTMGNWGATTTGTTSDTFSIASLPEGSYTLTVTATDAAGNVSTQTYSWTTDYTAPVVTTAASPDPSGATTSIITFTGSDPSAVYSYSIDGVVLTNQTSIFSDILDGSHTLSYTATDPAGNTTTGALSFDLSRYSLAGNVSAALLGGFGSVILGEVAGVSNQNWGGWSMDMAGSADMGIPPAFTMVAGGTSTDTTTSSNNGGYWIDIINSASDGVSVLSGTSTFKYLSFDRLGTGTGIMTGSYDGAGNWVATDTGAGSYTETPLAWSGKMNNYDDYYYGSLYTVDSVGISAWGYDDSALLGGTSSPWAGTTSLSLLGPYNDSGANMDPYIWTPTFYSYNVNDGSYMTYDTGSGKGTFFGIISGVWQNRTIDGRVYSLYIDPSGKAGILKGSLTGEYYPEISMYYADGTWTPIQLTTLTPPSTGIGDLTYSADWDWNDCGDCFTNSGSFAGGGYTITSEGLWRQFSISGEDWGIWQFVVGGDYTTPTSDTWEYTMEHSDLTHISGTRTEGTQWSDQGSGNKLLGTTYGYGADITAAPKTWISVGETIGTFDAAVYTWQAVQTGAWLDTNKFLDMVANNQAALTALNIPFAEVGKANLTGSGTIGGMSATAAMNGVTFFAYQTGVAPKIWATGDIQGTYTCTTCYAGTIPVAGDGLSANFNVQTFDTTGQKWIATVDGSGIYSGTGTMNGTNVNFEGAAAGTVDTSSTFSGTGAGVAK